MLLLGVESSCDDTSAAVVDGDRVLSNIVASQDEIHACYGGVVPELAARRHLETVGTVIARALELSGVDLEDLDGIAVTRGPGLIGSLLVGISAAQGLALACDLPLMGINHLEGHILSPLMENEMDFPYLAMLVSGGHTAMYLVEAVGDYAEVCATRDDSAGEAFDKAAKMLGLGYPGGRIIDELGRKGNPRAVGFPRPRVRDDRLALSFAGLKTSLWDFLHSDSSRHHSVEDVCASFQEAIVDSIVDRVLEAAARLGVGDFAVAGGVSANSRLRAKLELALGKTGGRLVFPSMSLCTDNAAMIAFAASKRLEGDLPGEDLTAMSRLSLGPRLSPQYS